jgi:hypothetical protein
MMEFIAKFNMCANFKSNHWIIYLFVVMTDSFIMMNISHNISPFLV